MTPTQIETVLSRAAEILTENLRSCDLYRGPDQFQRGVLEMLKVAARGRGVTVEPTYHPHAFPDIRVNGYGIEVKYSKRDTWNALGNSVFERMRDPSVDEIYVMFGKVGGEPEVCWRRYEDGVRHVRVSNAPRFVVDMESEEPPLFEHFGISYKYFSSLSEDCKMAYVRGYWSDRLRQGEHLWWLEPSHTVPFTVRLYMHLSHGERRKFRAEAALLCPQVCRPPRTGPRYDDAAMDLLTHHQVLCPQARDLFGAGSVALLDNERRGRNYVLRAMLDVEGLIIEAAQRLDDSLFVEYWGESCVPDRRVARWLELADYFARGASWQPSAELFKSVRG